MRVVPPGTQVGLELLEGQSIVLEWAVCQLMAAGQCAHERVNLPLLVIWIEFGFEAVHGSQQQHCFPPHQSSLGSASEVKHKVDKCLLSQVLCFAVGDFLVTADSRQHTLCLSLVPQQVGADLWLHHPEYHEPFTCDLPSQLKE